MRDIVLSVIITTYNQEEYILDGLNSIFQGLEDSVNEKIEIIITDDDSKDHTIQNVKTFKNKFINLKILEHEDVGHAENRNIGFKNSTGKFLFFLDGDDFIAKNSIKQVVQELEENSNFDIYIYGQRHEKDILPRKKANALNSENSTIIFRRQFLLDNNIFHTINYAGDQILILKTHQTKPKVKVERRVLSVYRSFVKSLSRTKRPFEKEVECQKELIENHILPNIKFWDFWTIRMFIRLNMYSITMPHFTHNYKQAQKWSKFFRGYLKENCPNWKNQWKLKNVIETDNIRIFVQSLSLFFLIKINREYWLYKLRNLREFKE